MLYLFIICLFFANRGQIGCMDINIFTWYINRKQT